MAETEDIKMNDACSELNYVGDSGTTGGFVFPTPTDASCPYCNGEICPCCGRRLLWPKCPPYRPYPAHYPLWEVTTNFYMH